MKQLPGDRGRTTSAMIRVDHAGEYGAKRIYQGQLAVMRRRGNAATVALVEHMQDQEQHHLDTFARLIGERRVRPTALLPFWHVAGWVLGAATAAMGDRAAMACTVAVEEAIDEHYRAQSAALPESEAPLRETIEQFRAEELEHRDTGLDQGAEQAVGYPLLRAAIGAGCRVAIALSEVI
jgi:ubiquinone biosynthesis monooxygenase Coq7